METIKVQKQAVRNDFNVDVVMVAGARSMIIQLQNLIDNSGRHAVPEELENLLRAAAVRVHTEEIIACVAEGSLQEAEKLSGQLTEIIRFNF